MLQSIPHAVGQYTFAIQNMHCILANIEVAEASKGEKWMVAQPAIMLFFQSPHFLSWDWGSQAFHAFSFELLAFKAWLGICPMWQVHRVAIVLLVANQAPQDEFVSTCNVLPFSFTTLKLLKCRYNVGPKVVPSLLRTNVFWKGCQKEA